MKHPVILHVDNTSAIKEDAACPQNPVPHLTVGFTAARSSKCLLSIIPVKVRSQTFCTEELRKKLDAKGKRTQIVLNTMGHDKTEAVQKLHAC